MPDEPRLTYWDAACFTSYVNGDEQRLPHPDCQGNDSRTGEPIATRTATLARQRRRITFVRAHFEFEMPFRRGP